MIRTSGHGILHAMDGLFISFWLLALAKVLPLVHLDLPWPRTYLDLDRLLALLLFLGLWARRHGLRPLLQAGVLLLTGGLLLIGLAAWMGLPVMRLAILLIMTALVEEILFRGGLGGWLGQRYGYVRALLASTLIYTLVHPGIYVWPLYGVAVFLTGVLCFMLYWRVRARWGEATGVAAATLAHGAVLLAGLQLGVL